MQRSLHRQFKRYLMSRYRVLCPFFLSSIFQAEEEALYKAQLARIDAEKAKANAEIAASNAEVAKANQATAEAGLKAKELDAQEAQTKAAVEAANKLASFLL